MIQPASSAISMADEKYTRVPIIWIRHWTPDLFSFRVNRPIGFRFAAGQFARIGLGVESAENIWRAYSIASTIADPYLEFFSVRVASGQFTPRLAQCSIGDELLIEYKAQGFLTLERFDNWPAGSRKNLWMIATGTGLSAFLSMISDPACWQRFETVVLIHTVRNHLELAYADDIVACAEKLVEGNMRGNTGGDTEGNTGSGTEKKLIYLPTLTRDETAASLKGRVTSLLQSGELERKAGLSISEEHSCIMLCGNPQMVEEMRALLKVRGLRMNRRLEPGHIVVENYW